MKSSTYRILNEVLNAVTHGVALGLSIVGLVFLLIKGAHISPLYIIAYTLYGSTLILLFLSSTLFHSLIFTKAKKIFQIFDHSSIYLLIAGSYTPYCLLSIQGALGIILMITIWLLAILGVIYKSITLHKKAHISKISTLLYIGMGWLCLVAIQPLFHSLGTKGVFLLLAGGISYTLGTIFYALKKIKFIHVIWHLFVILGPVLCFLVFF